MIKDPDSSDSYALIRVCSICGKINAIDTEDSEQAAEEMQLPEHTVKRLPKAEAQKIWSEADSKRCDHLGLFESLNNKIFALNGLVSMFQFFACACVFLNIAVIGCLSYSMEQKTIFDCVSKYALAYERADDKEEYMASIYNDVVYIDETALPPGLSSFIIKVKVSQFGKPE